MIEHVCRRAAESRHVDAVLVATDDERVAAAVRGFGADVRMTAENHPSALDRIGEVAVDLDCDLIVNLQGDEPAIDPSVIDAAVEPFAADPALQMTSVYRRFTSPAEAADPNVVKVVIDRKGFALYFSRSRIPFPRGSQSPAAGPFKHLGLYVYRRDFLLRLAALAPTPLELSESLEQLRVLEHGFAIRMVEAGHDSIGVDTPDDLERVRRLLTADTRAYGAL